MQLQSIADCQITVFISTNRRAYSYAEDASPYTTIKKPEAGLPHTLKVVESDRPISSSVVLKEGDIVIAKTAERNLHPKIGIVPGTKSKSAKCYGNAIRVRLKDEYRERVCSRWLALWLWATLPRSPQVWTHSTVNMIDIGDLRKLDIDLPDIDDQRKAINIVNSLRDLADLEARKAALKLELAERVGHEVIRKCGGGITPELGKKLQGFVAAESEAAKAKPGTVA